MEKAIERFCGRGDAMMPCEMTFFVLMCTARKFFDQMTQYKCEKLIRKGSGKIKKEKCCLGSEIFRVPG